MYGYQPKGSDDELVIKTLVRLAEQYPRFGFGKLFPLVRREQPTWNHKLVHRVYRALKLNLRRKAKKRLPSRHPEKLAVPAAANLCWSVDFMSDVLMSGQRPHESLGDLTPSEDLAFNSLEVSTFDWH